MRSSSEPPNPRSPAAGNHRPATIVGTSKPSRLRLGERTERRVCRWGFFQLTALAQAIGYICQTDKVCLIFISRELHLVSGREEIDPQCALALGALRVIPHEYQNVECRNIDVDAEVFREGPQSAARLLAEIMADPRDDVVAYRGAVRWVRSFEPINTVGYDEDTLFREGGVYLITGGLGGIGLTFPSIWRSAAERN